MKKSYFEILAIAFITIISICIVSCSPEPNEETASIVGIWEYQNGKEYSCLDFNENGKGHIYYEYDGNVSDDSDITYKYNSTTKTLTINENGEKNTIKVIELTENSLVIELNGEDKYGNKVYRAYKKKETDVSIIGIWEYQKDKEYSRLNFNENGKGHIYYVYDGHVSDDSDITYKYNSTTKTLTINGNGEENTIKVIELTNNSLVIELNNEDKYGNKVYREYKRKK